METNQYLLDHYGNNDEDGRLGSRNGSVEFLTTMRYIERYIKSGDRIIEIGAGTGRYSHALARMGYTVDAVELVPSNIEIFRRNTKSDEKISITLGNALDLSEFSNEAYDITLLLGPMYHLYNNKDKNRAISEALRVTKPGGVVFAAYCVTDASLLQYGFISGNIYSLMEPNDFFGVTMPGYKAYSTPKSLFEIVRKEDIDELMTAHPTTRLHYVATDLFTNHMRATVDAMDDKTFALYLDYHFFLCERADMVGLSHHVLDVFRK